MAAVAIQTQTSPSDPVSSRPTKLELVMNPKLKELLDENGDYIDPPLEYSPIKSPLSTSPAMRGSLLPGPDGEFKPQIPLSRSPKRFLPHNIKGHLTSVQEEKAMAAAPSGPIEASKLIAYVTERKKKKILLRGEFLLIRKNAEEGEREVGQSKENVEKNQYAEIIPYDRNRVILNLLPGDAHSDYINASYVDSWYEKQAYVITQGVRTKAAAVDFWRLVWESETNCVIMLTKVFDFMRVMCLQYWPVGTATYGDVQVALLESKTYAHFIMRTFKLSRVNKEGVGAPRIVTQFHFIEWELDSFPYISAFLELRRRVRKYLSANPSPGPILVHCSNGGARSGTFCSVDANLEMLEKENCADVFGFAKSLLNCRPHTLETLEQYQFMYDVLVEWIECKVAPIPLEGLQEKSSLYKNKKNRAEQETQDSHEYNLLMQLTPHVRIGDCAGGHRLENRGKNRDVMVVPPDNSRPYLQTLHGESKDYTYINAVYVDGFTRKGEWIVTEWPKQQTIDSLWALVFDHNAHTLVNLTTGGSAKKKGANFHAKPEPVDGEKDEKTFMISEIMASGSNAIQEAETRICCILTAKMWPIEHKVPLSTSGLLDLIKMARSWRKRAPDRPETKPTIVLSHNGRSRDEYKYLYDLMLHWYMTHPDYAAYRTEHQNNALHPA